MRICFAINNLQAGGAERVFSTLVNWFAINTRHTIYVLLFSYPLTISDFYHLDGKINVAYSKFRDSNEAAKVLAKINPDCIVSFLNPMNYIISLASKITGVPYITCERNNPYYSPKREIERKRRDEAFNNATGCVFQTLNAASYFYDNCSLNCQVKIIENPVCVKKRCDKEKKNRIVTVGRYAEQKNYPVLLEAFHEFRLLHPDYILDCYGKDSGKLREIKAIAALNKWDEGVSFYDPVESIHEQIGSAKLFLMTSLYEGMPNALAEAGALGLPCVAVDVPGVRDLIDKYHFGILCSEHDPKSIASAMEDLLHNDTLYSELSVNGEQIIDAIGVDKIAPLWKSFIEDIALNNHIYAI